MVIFVSIVFPTLSYLFVTLIEKKFAYQEIEGYRFKTSLFGKAQAFSHIYFIDGLLIDTGHSRKRKDVLNTLCELPVKQIFITHHHEDHTGNLKALKDQYQVDVWSSRKCSELMVQPPKLSLAQKLYWGRRPSVSFLKPKTEFIDTPSFKFEIIEASGHAEDMVVLYERNKGWLFSADLYINSKIGYFLQGESIRQQIDAISKVLELEFEALLCGHNPQLIGGKRKLKEKYDYLKEFRDEVLSYRSNGMNSSEIFVAMNLKEQKMIKWLSQGKLSKINMVNSVLEDYC